MEGSTIMFEKDGILSLAELRHSPHDIIPKLIEGSSIILDVGCNAGYLGQNLRGRNVTADGVDINDEALEIAKNYYRNVYKRDLYSSILDINQEQYDYIIFADILEHLPRPDLLLIDAKKYLKSNGQIIISLPNIARIEIRLKLLFGRFEYSPGILSGDHLRFFTKKSAIKMLENCGYTIKKIIPTGLGHILKIYPSYFAFQFVFVCHKQVM